MCTALVADQQSGEELAIRDTLLSMLLACQVLVPNVGPVCSQSQQQGQAHTAAHMFFTTSRFAGRQAYLQWQV
jgi:hypothetical protein